MDALKVIPQVFFDLIGRVVPGILALLLGNLLLEDTLKIEITAALVSYSGESGGFVSLTILLFVAFIIGHLISPVTKKIQRFNQWNNRRANKPEKPQEPNAQSKQESPTADKGQQGNPTKKPTLKFLNIIAHWVDIPGFLSLGYWFVYLFYYSITEDEKAKDSKEADLRSERYEWLRANHPEAGAHCAKLRSEFTMYNSFSAIFLISGIVEIVVACYYWNEWSQQNFHQLIIGVVFLILFIKMADRGEEGEGTFQKTVFNFHKAHNGPVN